MTKVKVFVYGRHRRRRRRRGYDKGSPDFRHGELKIGKIVWWSDLQKDKTVCACEIRQQSPNWLFLV